MMLYYETGSFSIFNGNNTLVMYEFKDNFHNKLTPLIFDKSTHERVNNILKGFRHTPKHIDTNHLMNSNESAYDSFSKASPLNNLIYSKSKAISSNRDAIKELFTNEEKIRLIEIGNSNSLKVKSLIGILQASNIQFEILPISNSKTYLEYYLTMLWQQFPSINIFPLAGNYIDILTDLASDNTSKLVVLSNPTAKQNREETAFQVEQISKRLSAGDWIQIDFELKSDPRHLSNERTSCACKDALINELNEILLGNFDANCFIYYSNYCPQTGKLQTCLVSTKPQKVYLAIINETISFKMWECISIESIQKYDAEEITNFALNAGFIPRLTLYDYNRQNCCAFWQKV